MPQIHNEKPKGQTCIITGWAMETLRSPLIVAQKSPWTLIDSTPCCSITLMLHPYLTLGNNQSLS